MRAARVLRGVAGILALVALATSQTCELWQGDPVECAPYLSGRTVYLYGNLTQTATADTIRSLVKRIDTQVPIAACKNASLPFTCKSAFPRCVVVNDTQGEVDLWEPQCRATCEAVNSACQLVYALANTSAINCTGANPFAPGFEFYPVANLSIPASGGSTLQSPCEGSVVVQAECPMTYLGIRLLPIPEDRRADFYVAPGLPCWRCPMPIFYTERVLHISWYGTTVIGALDVVGTFVLIILPMLLDARRRVFPAIVSLYVAIAGHGIGWSFMMAGIVGHRRTFCEHDWLSATWAYRPCAVQTFCITFFALCALMWTGALFLNVYRTIVQEKPVPPRWHIYQLIVCWGYPLVNAVVVVALKQSRFNEANHCFISDYWPPGVYTREQLSRPWVSMCTWYWPITILTIVLSYLVIHVAVKMLRTAQNWPHAWRLLLLQWRTFTYFLLFFYSTGYVIFLWINAETVREKVNASVATYITCLFAPPTGDSRDCHPGHDFPKGGQIGVGWTSAALGLWFIIVFGFGAENLKFWKNVFHNLRHGHLRISTFTPDKERKSSTPDHL